MKNLSQVFIFCAGRGERMMPLTKSMPKPMLKVGDKPILGHLINKINQISSVKKIIINAYYLADEIVKYIDSLANPKIIISLETAKIETGGGLLYALDKIDLNSPLLTLNGDVLWQDKENFNDIEYLYKNYNEENHNFLLGLKKTNEFIGYDGVGDFNLIDNKNLYRDFSQNNPCSYSYVGMQMLNPKFILAEKNRQTLPTCFSISHFYRTSVDKNFQLNKINGLELMGKYYHIGTPKNLETAQNGIKI
jgi:MurNAc alpha-1-phosphate uridylyltransferase